MQDTIALPKPLDGRTIAVTGTSRGIGQAIAELLVECGARVIAGSRSVSERRFEDLVPVRLDLTDEASVREFAEIAIASGVDSIIHNAGVGAFSPIDEISIEDYRRVMDTNVLGLILTSKSFIAHFRKRHERGLGSQLITITSDVSSRTFASGALYTASKHAQRALTRALACEGQDYGLRVTEIRPGMTDTWFNGNTPGRTERKRDLKAADVAQAVLYALTAPLHVRIDEVLLHPVSQPVLF